MRCDDVLINLPDYLLERTDPNLRRSIDVHLETCSRCRAELDEMKEPVRVLGEVGYEEYPDAFWQDLHSVIMEKVTTSHNPVRWRVPAFAGALAALLLVIGVGIFELSHKTVPPPKSISALATTLSPEQAVSLSSLNINYVNAVSSQASELDEMDAVSDSLQQVIVNELWSSVGDSTTAVDAFDYLGNSIPN